MKSTRGRRGEALRIGTVSFLNARPLTYGLDDVVTEVPSRLSDRFAAGALDVALLPVYEALRRPGCPRLPGMGVCSPGPVDSVLVLSREPLRSVRRLVLDPASRTSNALIRVLFGNWLEGSPEFVREPQTERDARLLIGDPALTAPREGLVVSDLALLWREHTGLPFCFAAWVARDEETAARARPVLEAALKNGLRERERIARAAARDLPLSEQKLLTYLTERITYVVGEAEERAIELFDELAR